LKHCPYCNRARREYWTPMNESAEWRAKTLMVEVMLDGEPALHDFDGAATTVREFGKRYGIRSVPTVIVFDTQGKPAAEPLVGLASADFYGAYLEQAVAQGLAKVRESMPVRESK
jgi:thioredoxin-related protein